MSTIGTTNTLSALYQMYKIKTSISSGGNGKFSTGYRPRQWNGTSAVPELLNVDSPWVRTINELTGRSISGLVSNTVGTGLTASELVYVKTNIGGYFFDAVLSSDHQSELSITQHPVQTGAAVTDHAVVQPAVLTMTVGMSDAMATMVEGQFTEAYTKSVSAYRVLKQLQQLRIPLQVVTRLDTYQNMLIQSIDAPDDYKTLYGLRCTVTLQEIFVVNVEETTVSARNWSTGSTNRGQVQPEPVSDNGSIAAQAGL